MRLSLNLFVLVNEGSPLYRIAQNLLSTLTISEAGKLDFIAHTCNWSVNFIRNKKLTSYIYEGKYILTVSTVREHTVNSCRAGRGDRYTVDLQDYTEHYEVEVMLVLVSKILRPH